MLTELGLRNFKSWREIANMRLAPITGLFGANSSGKSSILQLLLMLKQTVESADRTEALIFGDEKSLANLGSFRDVVFGRSLQGDLSFKVAWRMPQGLRIPDPRDEDKEFLSGDKMTFAAEVKGGADSRPFVGRMSYEFAGHIFGMHLSEEGPQKYILDAQGPDFEPARRVGRPGVLPAPIKCYGFPDQVRSDFLNVGFLSDLQLKFEEMFGGVYYLGPLREYPQRDYKWAQTEPADMGRRGERVVEALLAADKRQGVKVSHKRRVTLAEYVAKWLKDLGLIHDFSVVAIAPESNRYRVCVKKSASSPSVCITDVGFGVSQILPALVLCFYVPEGSTILLEQPEIHLHPLVQAGLADVFIDAVAKRNVQIVFESHSEHLLRRLQRRIAEAKIGPKDAALYFCHASNGESKLTQLEIDMLGRIVNWPKDFFGDEFSETAEAQIKALERMKVTSP